MEWGFSETVLVVQLHRGAAAFCASRIFITEPEQSAIVTVLSLANPVHMLPEEGAQGEQIKWSPHKVNISLGNKTCVLYFYLFY